MERIMGVGMWIDFNNDGDFDDTGEMVASAVPTSSVVWGTSGEPCSSNTVQHEVSGISVVIPSGVAPGFRTMRIRSGMNSNLTPISFTANQACANIPFGETEDRLVHIDPYPLPNTSKVCFTELYQFQFGNSAVISEGPNSIPDQTWIRAGYYPGQSIYGVPVPEVTTGFTYPLNVTLNSMANSCYRPSYYGVWIDFNNNLNFDDAGEYLGYSSPNGSAINIAIPANAAFIGERRMRIRKTFDAPPAYNQSASMVNGATIDIKISIKRSYGVLASGAQNMCPPADPPVITMTNLPLGNVIYNWYYKDGSQAQPTGAPDMSWTFINTAHPVTGATYPTYDPPAGLTVSRTYACYITPKIIGAFPSGWAQGVRQIRVKSGYCVGRMAVDNSDLDDGETQSVSLSQNIPNPFTTETIIPCFVPEGTQTASLEIYGLDGRKVHQIKLTTSGEQNVRIESKMLPASGLYLYTLVVDGQKQPMQRMVLAK